MLYMRLLKSTIFNYNWEIHMAPAVYSWLPQGKYENDKPGSAVDLVDLVVVCSNITLKEKNIEKPNTEIQSTNEKIKQQTT